MVGTTTLPPHIDQPVASDARYYNCMSCFSFWWASPAVASLPVTPVASSPMFEGPFNLLLGIRLTLWCCQPLWLWKIMPTVNKHIQHIKSMAPSRTSIGHCAVLHPLTWCVEVFFKCSVRLFKINLVLANKVHNKILVRYFNTSLKWNGQLCTVKIPSTTDDQFSHNKLFVRRSLHQFN